MQKKINDDITNFVRNNPDTPVKELAFACEVSERTIARIKVKIKDESSSGEDVSDVYDKVTQLTAQKQKALDIARVERKVSREISRTSNVIEELHLSLVDVLDTHKFVDVEPASFLDQSDSFFAIKTDNVVGIIQLSDIHFGEQVFESVNNKYDIHVLSCRMYKLIKRAIAYFNANGIKHVVLALTGDLINSDRRLDEALTNAGNRSKIVVCAVDILQQVIKNLKTFFTTVTVASVCGNESRVGKDLGWVDNIVSDNYDYMIHQILTRLFKDVDGVRFIEMNNPSELVLNVNNKNFLLIHGHNGLAKTAGIESTVSKLVQKYAQMGVNIDYIICGHIHSAFISDLFARSSSMVGSNAYSSNALSLSGRASQNVYIVSDGGIESIKIDLQEYKDYEHYEYDEKLVAYKKDQHSNSSVIIQSVLI